MNDAQRNRLFKLGLFAAYTIVPYSLTCMAIGGIYYTLVEKREDQSGDGFLSLVLGAPVTLPALVYTRLRERLIDGPALRKREALHRRIGNALVTALRADGIALTRGTFDAEGIHLTAIAPDERDRTRFGAAVARTVRQFPDVPLATVCGDLSPAQALDAAWATRHGFDDWSVDIGPACPLCGTKGLERWVFGRQEAQRQQRLTRETFSSFKAIDGTTKTIQGGYACEPCIAKIMDGKAPPDQDT